MPIQKTPQDWQKELPEDVYHVTREKGTEAPFSGEYWNEFRPGNYTCSNCGAPLFVSDNKFDASCGWPSFDRAAQSEAVTEKVDTTHGMVRREVVCTNCHAHLGHVFDDGPRETTGQRYCINSLSLKFKEGDKKSEESK